MKKYIIGITLIVLFVLSIINEPIADTIDAFSGATNSSYGPTPDSTAGASYDDDDDDDEHEDDHDEEEDDD
jgi:hypothetical protein